MKRYVLDNGITVVLDKRKSEPLSAMYIRYNVGSMDEEKGKTGLAHLTEHMMFKATNKRTSEQVLKEVKYYGAVINAYTDMSETCYFFEVLPQYFEKCLDVYADMLLHKNIPDEEFIKEKNVVLTELDTSEDDFESVSINTAIKKRYGIDRVIGKKTDVKKLTKQDVYDWIAKYYTPKRMTISIVSPFSYRKMLSLVKKYFGHLQKKSIHFTRLDDKIESINNQLLKTNGKILTTLNKREMVQNQVVWMVPLQDVYETHERTKYNSDLKTLCAISLWNDILSGGLSSILYNELREKRGLIYGIRGTFMNLDDGYMLRTPNTLILWSQTDDSKTDELISVTNEILSNTSKYIDTEILEKVKNRMLTKHASSDSLNIADSNAHGNIGDVDWTKYSYDDVVKTINKITLNDIYNIAETVSSHKPMVHVLHRPTWSLKK